MPSPATEDYLKAIYKLSQEREAATTSSIASSLGIAAGSVSGMLRRLSDQGLVEHVPYYGARLTRDGERAAVSTIRRHRILELFLVEVLGYPWDRVHEEAERLEHAASDELIARMAHVLGEPEADPHGAPIPGERGRFVETRFPSLAELEVGAQAVVRRVSDEDAEVLRYLGDLELRPGVRVAVLERAPFEGPLRVRVGDVEQILGPALAESVRVEAVSRGVGAEETDDA